MKIIIFIMLLMISDNCFSQGYNHIWLLGYDNWPNKGRMIFDTTNYSFQIETRKMGFEGTEATICDKQGNFIMSSNGVWIANSTNDTMLNGGGINPNAFTNSYLNGLLIPYADIFLPYPGDSNKIILFHHSAAFNGTYYPSYEVYYSIIDMTLDNGQGAVISKNNIVLQDTLGWGLAACRHANGRDWWIVSMKDNFDLIYKILLTPNGIENISTQQLGIAPTAGSAAQLTFSQNGDGFICTLTNGGTIVEHFVRLLDFDRCNGIFSNPRVIDVADGNVGWGLAFSPSGKYIYACSSINIFQIDTDSLTDSIVASYDGFYSPYSFCCATTFFNMYLAANGKIYITSGNGVQHIHEMNFPDSAGIACDVQQHSINLGIWNFRAVPNHPNYYLGPVVGSVCDSLTGINEHLDEIQNISIRPNPNNGNFSISYLLPQTATGGKSGWFEIYDVMGKQVYEMPLPPWSTMQSIQLPPIPTGIYNAVINSGYNRVSKKIAVIKE